MRRRAIIISHPIIILALLLIWQLLPQSSIINPIIFPPLSSVVRAGYGVLLNPTSLPQGLANNILVYLYQIAIAYLAVAVFSLFFGILAGMYKLLGEAVEPILLALYAVPHVIFYPVLILILGVQSPSKIVYALISSLPITFLSILAYTRQLDPNYTKVSRMVGASLYQLMYLVVIPAVLPGIEAALQVGLAFTIIGVTIAEILASSSGLGYLINWSSYLFRADITYFLVLLTIAIGLGLNLLYLSILRLRRT